MTELLDIRTVGGAHVRLRKLANLGTVGVTRVALAIDCRDFDRGSVWVSLTDSEARTLAEALSNDGASAPDKMLRS